MQQPPEQAGNPAAAAKPTRLPFFFIAVFVAWGFSLQGGFVWIDHAETESGSARIQSVEEFRAIWTQSLDEFLERREGLLTAPGGYFRPIYCLSLTADWLFSRGSPAWFHFENLLWHVLIVWLLYKLGCRLFEQERHGELMSFWAAMLFAVHPMCGQSVAWISGRKDLLCAAFALTSLLAFAWSLRERTLDGERHYRTRWYHLQLPVVVAPIALLLAILSKELAFVVPVVATMWWWFKPGELDITDPQNPYGNYIDSPVHAAPHTVTTVRTPRRGLLCLGGLWAVALIAAVYRSVAIGAIGLGTQYPAPTLLRNVEIGCSLLCTYALKTVLPLSPTIVDRWFVAPWGILGVLCMIAVGVTVLATLVSLLKRSFSGFCWAWFLIWMLPASGVLPLRHLYAERYMFPALWGLLAAGSHAYFRFLPPDRDAKAHRQKTIACLAATAVLAAISFNQTQYWQSDKKLFSHALAQDKNYVEGAVGLAARSLSEREYADAVRLANRALESADDKDYQSYWSPFVTYSTLGLAHYYQKQYEPARVAFAKAVEARPANAVGHYHLGLTAMSSGQLKKAEQHYEKAIQCQQSHYLSRSNLAYVYLLQQRYDDSVAAYEPLIVAVPEDSKNRANLASAYLMAKRYLDAEFQFQVLLRHSSDPVLHAKLAWAQWRIGRSTKALLNIKAAVDRNPQHPTVVYVANMIRQAEMRFRKPQDKPPETKEPPPAEAKAPNEAAPKQAGPDGGAAVFHNAARLLPA